MYGPPCECKGKASNEVASPTAISYNTDRNVATGNPYKELVADLMKRGAHIELCGATAKVHNWGNEDLLPGIKINTNAMARAVAFTQTSRRLRHLPTLPPSLCRRPAAPPEGRST